MGLYQRNEIYFSLLNEDAELPSRKHKSDIGLDVYSIEFVTIRPHEQAIIKTGVALAKAPLDSAIQVWPKSGLDAMFGLHTGAGIIDPGYRGEILILLKNMSDKPITIRRGDAIAQLVVVCCIRPKIVVTEKVNQTDRGYDGGINRVLNPSTINI